MRGSAKKTPTATKKSEVGVGGGSKVKAQSVEKSSGKKLKQARLPFKILASGRDESGRDATTEGQTDTRKRKLSFSVESKQTESETTENSKENVSAVAIKKAKTATDTTADAAAAAAEVVIVLGDSSDEDEAPAKAAQATKKKDKKETPKSTKAKTRQSGAGTPKQSKLVDGKSGSQSAKKTPKSEVNAKKNETPKVPKDKDDVKETTAKDRRASPKKDNTSPKEESVDDKNASKPQIKRRKSLRHTTKAEQAKKQITPKEQTDSSDDLEAIAIEQNPQKRLKVNETTDDKTEEQTSILLETNEVNASGSSSSEEEELNTTNTEVANADNEMNSDAGKNTTRSTSKTKNDKNLTPKQQKLYEQRRLAREEKERKLQQEKEEKQREKEEREQAKKLEREQRDEQRRKEREEKEEQRRKEREEKDEQKRLEREEKERKRVAEQELKNEEKRKKEQEKEEAEQKKKRESAAFTKFFLPKTTTSSSSSNAQQSQVTDGVEATRLAFQPFQVKGDMKLAPLKRNSISNEARSELDKFFDQRSGDEDLTESQLYLSELRAGVLQAMKWTKPLTETLEDDVLIVEDDLARVGQAIDEEEEKKIVERLRAKFLKFHENRRPPYYGTWRKKTTKVSARRPFAQDTKYLDYEVDSDLEWEEEEPGESLDGSCDEKDKESEDDDYEVDNEWFVPHGHLSDEELQNDEEFDDGNTRETQQAKLKILQQEFAQEMRKETKKIKPRLIGCIWVDVNGNQPAECPNIIWETLDKRSMICNGPILLEEPTPEPKETETNSPPVEKAKAIVLTPELQKELARLVHCNKHSKSFLINEYMAYLGAHVDAIKSGEALLPSKAMVREQIDDFAEWKVIGVSETDTTNGSNSNGKKQKKPKKLLCWVVSDNVLARLELAMLTQDNCWNYITTPKYVTTTTTTAAAETKDSKTTELNNKEGKDVSLPAADVKNKKTMPTTTTSIVKFTKVLAPPTITTTTTTSVEKPNEKASVTNKKRVPLLMSVPRGEQIPTSAKNALIKQYLKKDTTTSVKSANQHQITMRAVEQQPPPVLADDDDDIIMLD